MTNRTKWWKADLQVATPGWGFKLPAGSSYDFGLPEDRAAFGDEYMEALVEKGIEIIALAAHNTHEWIDEMVAAGKRHGVVVFPGCEITTASGADGAHLVIIGDLDKTGRDFDLLLASKLGFGNSYHDRFSRGERSEPLSSTKTVQQILDDLPEDYLVIAPHVLTENGIASEKTAKGDIRWKALHHPRLSALDPGDCSDVSAGGWNNRFRRRELDHFPCLREMAFVSTSDAYSFEELGKRFTWIRMGMPSIEALRQAFIDPEARVICDWDARLKQYPDASPNNTQHSWIGRIDLGGILGNSTKGFSVSFHPGLNVLIGGRGSGKSTVISAIRQLYGATTSLPDKIRSEVEEFSGRAFQNAQLKAEHYVSVSQEPQTATWSSAVGKQSMAASGESFPTAFRVRVISQKELFERVASDTKGQFSASRSLLGLIDEPLELVVSDSAPAGSWSRTLTVAQTDWQEAVRAEQRLGADIGQLPLLKAKVLELEGQVSAFASPQVKAKIREYRDRRREFEALNHQSERALEWTLSLSKLLDQRPEFDPTSLESTSPYTPELVVLMKQFDEITRGIENQVRLALSAFPNAVLQWGISRDATEWYRARQASELEFQNYTGDLAARGIEPKRVGTLETELNETQVKLSALERKQEEFAAASALVEEKWTSLIGVHNQRRDARAQLLASVQNRSGRLKFELLPFVDTVGWCQSVRAILGLRSDAFLEDLPSLASWIWTSDEETRNSRWALWREALCSAKLERIQEQAELRASWTQRLASADQAVRLRLAVEVPDDVVIMKFLKESGRVEKESDWQTITEGSPGQRTAAMLGLVLNYGEEPLVLDQPEDDLDSEWITTFLIKELRASRWRRQLIVASHEANIPVNGDAECIIALENSDGALQVRGSQVATMESAVPHSGPIEVEAVRRDIQEIMEGGVIAFMRRERRYNTEIREHRADAE